MLVEQKVITYLRLVLEGYRIMKDSKQKYTTLAIIGNGFDVAHNYNTRYTNFINCIGVESLQNYRSYVDTYGTPSLWKDFEKCAEELSISFYLHDITKENFNDSTVIPFNDAFEELKKKLMDYLQTEQERIPLKKKPSIEKYLGSETIAFTFNYTNLAEFYLDNVYYIHGSLKEQDIVLGFDPISPLCMAGFNNIQWFKGFCRERLAFRRYLRTQLNLSQSEPLFIKLCEEYCQIQIARNSGKGLEEDDITNLEHTNILWNYLAHEGEQDAIAKNKERLSDISTVVVLGHSLQSDATFLNSIFNCLVNLKEIILFTFPEDNEICDKIKFLKQYCNNIKLDWYDAV